MVLYVPKGTSGVISMLKTRLFAGKNKEGHGKIETREQQI
jgi:hypothetical protein